MRACIKDVGRWGGPEADHLCRFARPIPPHGLMARGLPRPQAASEKSRPLTDFCYSSPGRSDRIPTGIPQKIMGSLALFGCRPTSFATASVHHKTPQPVDAVPDTAVRRSHRCIHPRYCQRLSRAPRFVSRVNTDVLLLLASQHQSSPSNGIRWLVADKGRSMRGSCIRDFGCDPP